MLFSALRPGSSPIRPAAHESVRPRRFAALLLAGVLASPVAPVAPAENRPAAGTRPVDAVEEAFLKINSLYNRELYELAIPRYEKLLDEHPRFEKKAMVEYALALCHHARADALAARSGRQAEKSRQSHLTGAVEYLRRALKDDRFDSRPEALDLLAEDLLQLGDPAGAAEVYRSLLERSDGRRKLQAALGLAGTYHEAGDYPAAVAMYRRALALPELGKSSPERTRARLHLGLSLYEQGATETREARQLFEALAAEGKSSKDSAGKGGAPGSRAYPLDARYMAALACQKLGDHARALEHFRELAKVGEARWKELALYGEGSAHFERGDHARAVEVLEKLREEYPDSEQLRFAALYLGRAYLELGKLRSGARLLSDIRKDRDVGAEASLWLARAYSSADKHDQAVKILETALRRHGKSPHAETLELELAIELLAEDRPADAAGALKKFVERYPESSSRDHAFYLEAFVLHRTGRYADSAARCARFLEQFAGSRFVREVRQLAAENVFLEGEYEDAARLYRRYLRDFSSDLSPDDALLARYRLAESHFYRGDREKARDALEALAAGGGAARWKKALREGPVFESYRYLLGETSYQLKDYRRAAEEFSRYLERQDPRYEHEARFKLGHSLQRQGNAEGARKAYREALAATEKGPHRLEIHFELGQMAVDAKDYRRAGEAFGRVVQEGPRSELAPHACRFLGWIAQQEGRGGDAVTWYRKLVGQFPDHELQGDALYLLALSLQGESRFEEARKVLLRLEKEHPQVGALEKIELQKGVSLARAGKQAEAVAILEKLRDETLTPELQVLRDYELAWCYRGLKKTEAARRSYGQILALTAGGKAADSNELAGAARLELAELEFDDGRLEAARRLLEPLTRADGKLREKALYRLCWCHHREGRRQELMAAYRDLQKSYPRSELIHEATILLARTELEHKNIAEAARLFRSIFSAKPRPKEADVAEVGHAECLNKEGRFTEARQAMLQFLRDHASSPQSYRAHFALGWAEENLGNLDVAVKSYRKASGKGTAISARAQFQIGQCVAAEKKYEDAIVEFLQVSARYSYPEWSCRSVLQVAGCFEALEDYEKARKYYNEVLAEYPERAEAKLARERLEGIEGL